MLAALPGTAAAQPSFSSTDFCDSTQYDNAPTQSTGLFTDLHSGGGINADYTLTTIAPWGIESCLLNITGSVGSAGDMWITLLGEPGSIAPTFDCVFVGAFVQIHRFDNRKAVGFVFNYDPGTGKGLFWGLYDNGNNDALALSTFDGMTGKLTGTVATFSIGSRIKENVWYELEAEVCNDGTHLAFSASVQSMDTDTPSKERLAMPVLSLPAGISRFGQIGIAGQAKSTFVDSSVADFFWSVRD